MIYNIHFELATAVMLFILVLVYFIRESLPIRRNRQFLKTLFFLIVDTILSALQCYAGGFVGKIPDIYICVLNIFVYLTGIIFIVCYNSYVLSIFHYKKVINFYSVINYGIFLAAAILIVTSPLTGWYFYIGSDGIIHSGMARNIMNVLYMMTMFMTIAVAETSGKKKDKKLYRMILVTDIIITMAAIADNINKNSVGITMIVANMCTFLLYFSMKSPDYYLDIRTGRFNLNGFMEVLREKID